MDSKRTYVYNVVLRENDVCPQGELLTDKELERIHGISGSTPLAGTINLTREFTTE